MRKLEAREVERYQLIGDLSVVYEGSTDKIPVYPADLSTRGMFIPTTRVFPVGSVLKVSFRLRRSRFYVRVRAEVRHSVPGAGMGVEFLELSLEAIQAIEKEIAPL